MQSIVKLVGISSCCLVGGVAAANAEPTILADAELDVVTAGSCSGIPNCVDPPGGFFQRSSLLRSPLSRLGPFVPVAPDPNGPVPTEPPGCETGACGPFPGLPSVVPAGFPSIPPPTPLLTPLGFGGCGGPAGTCAYNPGGAR